MKPGSFQRTKNSILLPPLVTQPPAPRTCLIVLTRGDDVVDLQDELHHLRGEQHLLLLPDERLEHALLLHVVGSRLLAVHAEVRVLLLELLRLAFQELGRFVSLPP